MEYKILIVGLVRNCETSLENDFSNLEKSFSGCSNTQWLLIEIDSNDGTLDVLSKLKNKHKNFEYITHGKLREKYPLRTERIAFCRNTYVNEINGNLKYSDVDYIVVADLDGVNSMISEQAVSSCWSQRSKWDVCTANQEGPYYDIWALRHQDWCSSDCYKQRKFLIEHGVGKEKSRFASTLSKMVTIHANKPWIQVDSAFGGLAIYKKSLFVGSFYSGIDDVGDEICEHVFIHSQMRSRGAKIYINPSLINGGWNEHSSQLRIKLKVKRLAWDFLEGILTPLISDTALNQMKTKLKN